MSQRDLARASGMPLTLLGEIERATCDPTVEQVQVLAQALGVDDYALTWA
jgi:transcriptional regulator with XRE-family HTH domain